MAITASTGLKTEIAAFQVNYHKVKIGECVSFVFGDIKNTIPLVRIHSACLFGEAFHSIHCDCKFQLYSSMEKIAEYGSGVVIYAYEEGRGIGLEQKVKAMSIQEKEGCDTVEAFKKLGYEKADFREHSLEALALKDLKINPHIKLISGNPNKIQALEAVGFIIQQIIDFSNEQLSKEALEEKRVKEQKLGYHY